MNMRRGFDGKMLMQKPSFDVDILLEATDLFKIV